MEVEASPPTRLACSRDLDIRVREFASASIQRASFSYVDISGMTPWHLAMGSMPFDVLAIIHHHVKPAPLPPRYKRTLTYQRQLVEARGEIDRLTEQLQELQIACAERGSEPARLQRVLEHERAQAHDQRLAATAAAEQLRSEYLSDLKEQRATHAFELTQLLGEQRGERSDAIETQARLENNIKDLERKLKAAHSALRAGGKQAEQAQAQLEGEVQRLRDGRAWARAREADAARARVEAQRDELKAEVARLSAELNGRSRSHAAEKQELHTLRGRVKTLQKLNASYEVKSNRKFFEVDPIAEQNEQLRQQLEAQTQESRGQLQAAVAEARQKLDEQQQESQRRLKEAQAEAARFKAIAEPHKTRFFKSGHFSSEVDLAIIRALQLGVTRRKVPALFGIFARLFGVTLPGRSKKVPGPHVDGKPTTVWKFVMYTPGATHITHVAGMMYQLNKLQMGEWLIEHIESDETSCCYIADGAESQQIDYLGQLLSRRINGKIEIRALDLAALSGKTADAQAEAFHESLHAVAALMEKAGMADARAADLIRKFIPTCSMNDRASPARAAARKVLGLPDGDNDPTCAEHGLVNILEEGRKAMDKELRLMMDISDEQAEGDAKKIKAMRTCVGWFSSPACALIYQVAKYCALCSSKGYAIGQKFREWIDARLADQGAESEELLGFSEDLLAICGSRMYVFFIDAAVTERLVSQMGSLLTFLEEEDDLGAEGGGKLRKSILTGAGSEPCMAAVRSMAIICDAVLWPLLRAVKPSLDQHMLDVLPVVWPKAVAFFEAAAASPASVIDGSLKLDLGETAPPPATDSQARRSERARIDMVRIRSKATGDELVHKLLTSAFTAMVAGTKNHASEWLGPDGKLCAEKITLELRERYDALPSTSTCVERIHAVGRRVDDSGGMQRYENRAGISLAMFNNQSSYLETKDATTLEGMLKVARGEERKARKATLKQRRIEAGCAKQVGRDEKLSSKRERREKKKAEKVRIEQLELVSTYSALKAMSVEDLKDQLKGYKLQGKTGFALTQENRAAYVLQVQALMSEALGEGCNDLADGDSGVDGRGVRRKKVARDDDGSGQGGKKKKAKAKRKIISYMGWEWYETEKFIMEKLIGKMTAVGPSSVPGRTGIMAGTVLYRVLWKGFPPEAATWEEASVIHDDLIDEYEAGLEAEEELEGGEESDDESEDGVEE